MGCRLLELIVGIVFLSTVAAPARSQPAERPERGNYPRWREIVKKYDRDGDRRLDAGEREALRKDVIAGRLEVPPQVRERFRQAGRRPGALRTPDNVIIERDVEYGRAGDRPLLLDIVRPKTAPEKPLPLVVFIHGGGWRHGDKTSGTRRVALLVATGNYIGASIGYRLTGEAKWPAQIHDCKAAIRWLRVNAEKYGIDPQRIAVWGSSAGGHLVNMLGTSGGVKELEGANGSPEASSRVRCVIDFCGPSNFLAPEKMEGGRKPSAVTALLGGEPEDKKELAKEASPITYVSRDDPPFLIVHGTEDEIVPLQQAEMLNEALKKAGVDVTFIKIEGGGHGIREPEAIERATAFLEKHLRGRKVEISDAPIRAIRRPRRKPARQGLPSRGE